MAEPKSALAPSATTILPTQLAGKTRLIPPELEGGLVVVTRVSERRSAAGPATDGARRKHPNGRKTSIAAHRRQGPAKAPPTLSRDDRATLRRLAAPAGRHLDLLLDGGGRKEALCGAYDLAEELGSWLRRCEPRLYARKARGRP